MGAVGLALLTLAGESRPQQPGPVLQAEVDKLGDRLPTGAIQRIGTARFRHGSNIQCLAYSPDGKTLAAGGGNDVVRLWDATSGKLIRTLPLNWVQALAFSKDGQLLAAAGSGKTILVFDVQTGATKGTLQGSTGPIRALAFAQINNETVLLSAGQDKLVRVWDCSKYAERQPLRGHEDEVTSLVILGDGNTAVSGSGDYTVRYWKLDNGQNFRTVPISAGVTALTAGSDGKSIACAGDDGIIRILDAEGKEAKNWKAHNDAVLSLVINKEGKTLISSGSDNAIIAWNLATGEKTEKITTLPGDAEAIALAPDQDTLAYAGQNHTVHRWSLNQKKELTPADGPQGAITSLAVSPNEKYLAYVDGAGNVFLLETATQKELHHWKVTGAKDPVLAFSPDGSLLAAASAAGKVQLWQIPGGKEQHLLSPPAADEVECLVFSPAAKTLAVGYRKAGIRLWNTETGKVDRSMAQPEGIYALAYSPDGSLLAGAGLEKTIIWKGGEQWRELADKQRAASLAFSPDGKTLATGHFDASINLWNMADGKKTVTFEGHGSAVYSLAFSATGRRLLSSGFDRSVRVWEPFSIGQIVSWTGATGPVYSVAFSPDGRRVYSGSADTAILVWDATRRSPGGKLAMAKLNQEQLEGLWKTLATGNAGVADNAAWSLIAGGDEAIDFLHKRVYLVDRNELDKLIKDLDSEKFSVRAKATKTLEGYGLWIQGRLKEASDNPLSLEQKLRLDQLLEKLTPDKQNISLEQERFRLRRVMEILEQVRTKRAIELLVNLSKGAAENAIADEAAVALKRVKQK
jgi:WD40 repeat protein